jgi:tetratricopeptide (TPR) repeat protein
MKCSLSSPSRQQQGNPNQNVENARIYSKLADLHMKKGDYPKALSELGTSNTFNDTPENYRKMARCHEKLGQIEEAIQNYRHALENANKNDKLENKRERNMLKAEIYLDRGRLMMSRREPANAKKDFDDALLLPDIKGDSQLVADVSLSHPALP